MRLSVIVPVYNEESVLAQLGKTLAQLPPEVEVLIADGGSTDRTAEILGRAYAVIPCPKGRAAQMNAAAEQSSGDVLWFVHADSLLPQDGPEEIIRAAESGARFGCFHIRFDRDGPLMAWNALASNLRARRGIPFGDQGMFIERGLFERIGGFPELPIMEDYALSRDLRGRKIACHVLPGCITASARRYQDGTIRAMVQMLYLRHLFRRGHDIHDIARRYRDIR